MVKFSDSPLDRTFAALADPTRRALVMRLAAEPDVSVSALAAPFAMSLPAVMKHLDVLSDAGLVSRAKTGRVVACRLDAEPMREAFEWLNRYEKFWSERLSSLAAFLDELASYSRELNEMGEPTEKIDSKESFHLMDAMRYIIGYLNLDRPKATMASSPVAQPGPLNLERQRMKPGSPIAHPGPLNLERQRMPPGSLIAHPGLQNL